MRCERDVECPAFDETWDLYNYTVNPRKLTEFGFTNVVTGEYVSLSTEESSSSAYFFTCTQTQMCICSPSNYQSAYNDQFDIRSNSFQNTSFEYGGTDIESSDMNLAYSYARSNKKDFGTSFYQDDKNNSEIRISPKDHLIKDHLIGDSILITESVLLKAYYEKIPVDSILIQYQQGLVAFWVGDTLWMRDDI